METVAVEDYITDEDGCGFPVWRVGKLYLPINFVDPQTRLRQIAEFDSKDGDVMICSFPKTGTNWLFELVKMLRTGSVEIQVLRTAWLAFHTSFQCVRNQTPPRTYITHLPPDMAPRELLANEKTLLLCRNPKDSAVSLYHFIGKLRQYYDYRGTWDAFLQLYTEDKVVYSSFFDYYCAWDKLMKEHPEYKVLLVYYEDLHQNGIETLRKICEFLELERSDGFLQSVIDRCQLDPLKRKIEEHPEMQEVLSQESDDNTFPYMRKGIVGDWKNLFTVAQNEAFSKLMEEKFSGTRFAHRWDD